MTFVKKDILKKKLKNKINELDNCEYKKYLEESLNNISKCHAGYFSQDNAEKDEEIIAQVNDILMIKKKF